MKELLYKEFRITVPRPMHLILLLGVLILLPNYPSIVSAGYCLLLVFLSFVSAREKKDVEFTAVLPVTRAAVVKAKIAYVYIVQAAQLVFLAALAPIADYVISPQGNLVGMDPNLAFFGIILLGYSGFNLVFLLWYCSSGTKIGFPALCGVLTFVGIYVAAELLIQLTPLRFTLDSLRLVGLPVRAGMLAVCLVLYLLTALLCYRVGSKRFEKISL